MLQSEGWLETNTYGFPTMMVLELHYLNCYQNTKSNFSNKVPILQRILMDSVFIQLERYAQQCRSYEAGGMSHAGKSFALKFTFVDWNPDGDQPRGRLIGVQM